LRPNDLGFSNRGIRAFEDVHATDWIGHHEVVGRHVLTDLVPPHVDPPSPGLRQSIRVEVQAD
jgi:hypothetical protein